MGPKKTPIPALIQIARLAQRRTLRGALVTNYVVIGERLRPWKPEMRHYVGFTSAGFLKAAREIADCRRPEWNTMASALRDLKRMASRGYLTMGPARPGACRTFVMSDAELEVLAGYEFAALQAEGVPLDERR